MTSFVDISSLPSPFHLPLHVLLLFFSSLCPWFLTAISSLWTIWYACLLFPNFFFFHVLSYLSCIKISTSFSPFSFCWFFYFVHFFIVILFFVSTFIEFIVIVSSSLRITVSFACERFSYFLSMNCIFNHFNFASWLILQFPFSSNSSFNYFFSMTILPSFLFALILAYRIILRHKNLITYLFFKIVFVMLSSVINCG